MKKRATVVLEVESEDEFAMTDSFIRNDLETEINCASNSYDVLSIETEVVEEQRLHGLVYIVSWYDIGQAPVVTAFNNRDAAMRCYNHALGTDRHVKVEIDECPIYETFSEGGSWFGE